MTKCWALLPTEASFGHYPPVRGEPEKAVPITRTWYIFSLSLRGFLYCSGTNGIWTGFLIALPSPLLPQHPGAKRPEDFASQRASLISFHPRFLKRLEEKT
jgi:hypothetical protein